MIQDLKNRFNRLSSKQKELLAKKVQELQSGDHMDSQNQKLVAFVKGSPDLNISTIQSKLKSKLPNYMIPSQIVVLDDFPRLPNGKVDQKALTKLQVPKNTLQHNFTAPQNPIQQSLAKIWQEVLKIPQIGIYDNFFEIGGDSILSIQIIAKARKLGLQLRPNQLFEYQTIAELAPFVQQTDQLKKNHQVIIGALPLLPIQKWFFEEHKQAPHHWNQNLLIQTKTIDIEKFAQAIDHLTTRHDMLRARFAQNNENTWKAFIDEPRKQRYFQIKEAQNLSKDEFESFIRLEATQYQKAVKLSEDPLFQAILFQNKPSEKQFILLTAHHLIVDAVSWQIIYEELLEIYEQILSDKEILLSGKTTSYKAWAEFLLNLKDADDTQKDLKYWQEQEMSPGKIPTDFSVQLPLSEEKVFNLESQLDETITSELLELPKIYPIHLDEVLLTAFLLALKPWAQVDTFTLGLEKHGREILADNIDFSSTVGWFTSTFPIKFQVENRENDPFSLLYVKEKIRNIPNSGLSYGILRYHTEESSLKLNPEILFNYLGKHSEQPDQVFGKKQLMFEGARSPESKRYQLLEINIWVQDNQLISRLTGHEAVHQSKTLQKLLDAYHNNIIELIHYCNSTEDTGYSPSDFPEADLNQEDLDNLLDQLEF